MIANDTWRRPIDYPLSLTLAVLAGFFWIIFSEREERVRQRTEAENGAIPDPFIAGVSALTFALITARLGYIALHLDYYQLNPAEIFFFWEGGLSGVIGTAGALVGLGAYALYSHASFWQLGDALAVPAQLVLLGSWAGCWFEGCAYGVPTDLDMLIMGTDPYVALQPRWPTQGMGVIFSFISYGGLIWLGEQETPAGLRFAVSLTAGALSAAVIGLYRADPVLLIGPARLDTLGYTALAIVGMIMMAMRLYKSKQA